MAIGKLSALLGDLRGRVGGIQFARRANQVTVTSAQRRRTRTTAAQWEARANLLYIRQAWLALSNIERGHWDTWASMHPRKDKVGQEHARTGLQAFQWWYAYGTAGAAQALSPNYNGPDHALASPSAAPVTLDVEAGDHAILETGITIYPAYYQYLQCWVGFGGDGRRAAPNRWWYLGLIYTESADVDIASALAARDLVPVAGQQMWARAIHLIRGIPDYWPSEMTEGTGYVA